MTSAANELPAKASQSRLDEIVDVAALVFYEQGYDAASVQDVATRAGLLKGSLYHYIDTKADLLFMAIEDQHREYDALIQDLAESTGDVLSVLRSFVYRHEELITKDVVRSTLFFREFRALPPDKQSVILAQRRKYESFLRTLIQEGQRDGTFRRDVDPALAAKVLFGMLNWTYTWYSPTGAWKAADIARAVFDLTVGALASETSRQALQFG
jgi:TetR/AcrR family transcriptional regulator, cholesterol catabolism regulator